MKEKRKIRNESAVFVAVLFGILVLGNLLSFKLFFRGDLTQNRMFTLSEASLALVRGLEDRLIVKAYFTKNLPGRYASLERNVRDLLEEYAEESGGKMEVAFIDPAGNEEEEKVASGLGIQKMPNPDIEKDQATVKEGYRGIAFSYGDKPSEAIPAVESPIGLEYQVTSILKKLLGKKEAIGFLVGHGEPEIEQKPEGQDQMMMQNPRSQGAFRIIRENLNIYDYRQVDLQKTGGKVPRDLKALVVAGPREQVGDRDLYAIDQFLLSGGGVAFFVDGVNVSANQPQFPGMPVSYSTAVNPSNFTAFLKHFGVETEGKLVMDAQASNYFAECPPIPIPLPRPYPAWPRVTGFDDANPIAFNVGSLTLPYVSPVRAAKGAAGLDGGAKMQEFVFSSGNAWTADGASAVVDPCAITMPASLKSNIPLAVSAKGSFSSYFKGKPVPPPPADAGKVDLAQPEGDAFIEKSSAPGRLVVVGSAGLPADETLSFLARMDKRQALSNFAFVQNVLDWLTNDEGLIAVRMKTQSDPPLVEASEGKKAAAKYGNIVGVPLAFLVFGLIRWRVRRAPKKGRAKS